MADKLQFELVSRGNIQANGEEIEAGTKNQRCCFGINVEIPFANRIVTGSSGGADRMKTVGAAQHDQLGYHLR